MIISASRRTDIPSYYSEWFVKRLQAGSVCVRNPMNYNQISQVPLNREVVDCIVFWTKNPIPMLSMLDTIDEMGYPYYFQFTITPYNKNIETSLGDKQKIIESFCFLSKKLGKDRVIWRYDPIIVNKQLTVDFHIDAFEKMSKKLSEYTDNCIISFVDPYKKALLNTKDNFLLTISEEKIKEIAKGFSEIADSRGIKLKTCAEKIDLHDYGIEHASCIDRNLIEKIIDYRLMSDNKKAGYRLVPGIKKDGQRDGCECIECIDIGAYDSCLNGCVYCYGTNSFEKSNENFMNHDSDSEILIGKLYGDEKITDRKVKSLLDRQIKIGDNFLSSRKHK